MGKSLSGKSVNVQVQVFFLESLHYLHTIKFAYFVSIYVKVTSAGELPKLACFDNRAYKVMRRCWTANPAGRISFEEIKTELRKLKEEFMASSKLRK